MFSIIPKKKCNRCEQRKDRSEFQKHKGHKDGLDTLCKSCVNERKREQYRNSEEKDYERNRLWRLLNPQKVSERTRRWQKAHPEKFSEIVRKYQKGNTESKYAGILKWRKSHPEKVSEYNRTRLSLRRGGGGRITAKEWEDLKKKYDYTCLCCKRKEPDIELTHDHVVPLDKGGANTIENSQCLCRSCNSRKGNKTIDYRLW